MDSVLTSVELMFLNLACFTFFCNIQLDTELQQLPMSMSLVFPQIFYMVYLFGVGAHDENRRISGPARREPEATSGAARRDERRDDASRCATREPSDRRQE